ncbi:DUF4169 family protein [Rhodovulum sp. 12E13]|uniref:DUF4169 family protein n=1 Tax=Rhodovulum sp. 12E13 TaxID=2203891 RepID=UPI000E1472C3|nr:DUF4169 family protein [Rhodovulum sp. 12E13]RDC73417.1 DUF4169 family protein [Rhodovulum sp. 12E13]
MTEPVNLNRVRKERAKAEAKRRADANAAFHGLTKAQKQAARAEAARAAERHAAGRRESPQDE